MPVKAGSATKPSPGFDVRILDDQGNELPANQQGNIAIKLPLPPSCLPTIWKNFDRFKSGYLADFPGYYCSGDGGYKDDDGYVFIMGRTDDVINIAGHRFSTGEMEELVASHEAVAGCAVIGIADSISKDWDIVFVAGLSGQGDKAPTTDEAEPYLNQMANDLASGQNIARYVVFDRNNQPLNMQPS